MTEREHLTAAEASALVGVSPKRLRQLMAGARPILREGVHYARPGGIRTRFFRAALIRWLEGRDRAVPAPRAQQAPRPPSTVNEQLLPPEVRQEIKRAKRVGDRFKSVVG